MPRLGNPADDGIPYQENGLRFKIEPSTSAKSTCKGCKGRIETGSTRVGSSAQQSLYGGWLFRHLCCTNSETVRDIRKTYQIDGLLETINHDADDYSVVPRFNLLTESEKKLVTSHFKSVLFDKNKTTTKLTKEELRLKEVEEKHNKHSSKKNRQSMPIEELDWRAELSSGKLDDESKWFIKKLLRSLGLPYYGTKIKLLNRLKAHAKAEEEKEKKYGKKKKNSKDEPVYVISNKKRRKLLPELDLEADL